MQTICVFPDGSIEELFTDPAKLQELMETVFSTENLVNVLMEMVRKSLDYLLLFMSPQPPLVKMRWGIYFVLGLSVYSSVCRRKSYL